MRNQVIGLYVGVLAMNASMIAQTVWLWWRSREWRLYLSQRDLELPGLTPPMVEQIR